MNYRIDPRGPQGGADLVMAMAKAKTGDSLTVLLPMTQHKLGNKLLESLRKQAAQGGLAMTFQLETIEK